MKRHPSTVFTWLVIGLLIAALGCAAQGRKPAAVTVATAVQAAAPNELLPNGRMPFEGVLTGGQPTAEQLAHLRDLGYRTVINLRRPDEEGSTEPEVVESLGMRYASLPINGAQGTTEDNARRLAGLLKTAEYPLVVHCASGNRVGAIFALKAYYLDGESAQEALAIGRAAGMTRLEPLVQEQLALAAAEN